MEACDEQWVRVIKSEPRFIPSIPPHGVFEMGFRAALEWTEQLYKDEVVGGPSNGLYLFRKKIRQELGEDK